MFLGIDIGTSAVKAVLLGADGQVVASAAAPLSVSRPTPGWSEQAPDDWWTATNQAVLGLPAVERAATLAIGLSGQMHGATVLDSRSKPLRPAILWNDGRSALQCRELEAEEPEFLTHGANRVMPGFTAPKLAWLRRHEAEVFNAIATVLLPKDYVRLKMTGELATDRSDAAGTLWMDVEKRRWHAPLLAACGLTESQMPTLYDGPEITGNLIASVSGTWGMRSVPVVAGAGDNAAGAIGAGVTSDGETMLSLGTSGVIFTASDSFRSRPAAGVHAFCHALPNRWHLMSVMLSAASCLEWACKATNVSSVETLVQLAEQADRRNVPVFLPYLSGERTPHNDPNAAGVLFGLTHDSGPAEIADAVLQGVAFGMADGFDALTEAGAHIDTLSVIGGGARSAYWGRMLAAAIGRPLCYRESATVGPALGAARLAATAVADGNWFSPPSISATVTPERQYADALSVRRAASRNLYQMLKPAFEERSHAVR
ncbi:MAG: xylulokinase [Pseudomonadota bacterium]